MKYEGIIKEAFQQLGGSNVPDAGSVHYGYAQGCLGDVVKSVLEEYTWGFARKLVELAKGSDGGFVLPSDYCGLAWISCERYTMYGNKVMTNAPEVTLIYQSDDVSKDEDVIKVPMYFKDLVRYRLCERLAPYMTGDPERGLVWSQMYDKAFAKATVKEMDTRLYAERNIDPVERMSGDDHCYQY